MEGLEGDTLFFEMLTGNYTYERNGTTLHVSEEIDDDYTSVKWWTEDVEGDQIDEGRIVVKRDGDTLYVDVDDLTHAFQRFHGDNDATPFSFETVIGFLLVSRTEDGLYNVHRLSDDGIKFGPTDIFLTETALRNGSNVYVYKCTFDAYDKMGALTQDRLALGL